MDQPLTNCLASNDVKNMFTKQYLKDVQTGNTTKASFVQGEITQLTATYQQNVAALAQRFGVS